SITCSLSAATLGISTEPTLRRSARRPLALRSPGTPTPPRPAPRPQRDTHHPPPPPPPSRPPPPPPHPPPGPAAHAYAPTPAHGHDGGKQDRVRKPVGHFPAEENDEGQIGPGVDGGKERVFRAQRPVATALGQEEGDVPQSDREKQETQCYLPSMTATTAVMLSGPPRALAISTNRRAHACGSRSSTSVRWISASSSTAVRPSVHKSSASPGPRSTLVTSAST